MLATRRQRLSAAGFLSIIAITIVVGPARGGLVLPGSNPAAIHSPGVVPRPANPATTLVDRAVPRLTTSESQLAVAIASGDGSLRHLLQGHAFRFAHIGPWTTGGEDRQIGAVLFLELAHPATIDGNWPAMTYTGSDPQSYATHESHLMAVGLRTVLVQVDLTRRKVAGIMPLAFQDIHR